MRDLLTVILTDEAVRTDAEWEKTIAGVDDTNYAPWQG